MVEMRLAVEMIKALKYKLWMFGIEIMEDETKIFGDNNAVIINTSVPESTLKKKHHSINYNYVRESIATGIVLKFKVDTGSNLADQFKNWLIELREKKLFRRYYVDIKVMQTDSIQTIQLEESDLVSSYVRHWEIMYGTRVPRTHVL